MNDTILAITVLLGMKDELWFNHERPACCWTLYLWTRRN